MNKNLRKRKIKALMKISSYIMGESWDEYEEKTIRSMASWNWSTYKVDELPFQYGLDSPEAKRNANIEALKEIKKLFVEYYIFLSGETYSEKHYEELESKAFLAYKQWYQYLLKTKNKSAISPLKTVMFLKEEINSNTIIPDVDKNVVSGYEFHSITLDIDCSVYKKYLGSEFEIIYHSEFMNMLKAGRSSYPLIKYICLNNTMYKVEDSKRIDEDLSRNGLIECRSHIPYDKRSIMDHISKNSTIGLINNDKKRYIELDLSSPADYAFATSWINKIEQARIRHLASNSITAPEVWVSNKIKRDMPGGNKTIKIRQGLGLKGIEVFDLKKDYGSPEPIIFFEKNSSERMTIMSDEKLFNYNAYTLASEAGSLAEKLEFGSSSLGLFSESPYIVGLSIALSLIDYGLSIYAAGQLEALNSLDIESLNEKEQAFIRSMNNFDDEARRIYIAQDAVADEYGAVSTALAATGITADITNDSAGLYIATQVSSDPSKIQPRHKYISRGIQLISVAISFYDMISGKNFEKTEEIKAAERDSKIIVDKARVIK